MTSKQSWFLCGSFLFCGVAAGQDDSTHLIEKEPEPSKNRFGMGPSMLFNVSVKLRGLSGATPPPGPGGPTDIQRNYQDGFVGVDSTGNAGGVTSFWRYENASQYDPSGAGGDGSIAMHVSDNGAGRKRVSDDPHLGFELNYSRHLAELSNGQLGFEAAFNYTPLSIHSMRRRSGETSVTTDFYSLGGAEPLPPGSTGSFNRGGGGVGGGTPLLDAAPYDRTITFENTDFRVRDEMDAHFFNLRVGPSYEMFFRYISIQMAGGFSMGALHNHFVHRTQTVSSGGTARTRFSDHETDFLYGFYAGGKVSVNFVHGISLFLGGSFHSLGGSSQRAGPQRAVFDFSESIYGVAGVSYSF